MHPLNLLDEEDWAILEMFYVWRGGMGGNGPLPFNGGYAEQPAALMLAFRYMSGVVAKLEKRK